MGLPANIPLTLYRGDSFTQPFGWGSQDVDGYLTPVDMTGGTLLGQIRAVTDPYTSAVLATFTITSPDSTGQFTLSLAAATLATVTWENAVYDVQFTSASGIVTTLVYGTFDLTQDVSHS